MLFRSKVLSLASNLLTSVPAEIGQLRSLKHLWLSSSNLEGNKLTSLLAAIGELEAGGCRVYLNYQMTDDGWEHFIGFCTRDDMSDSEPEHPGYEVAR